MAASSGSGQGAHQPLERGFALLLFPEGKVRASVCAAAMLELGGWGIYDGGTLWWDPRGN